MNPLDLRGPDFLVFYVVVGAAVLGILWLLRRQLEKGMAIPGGLTDPYLIAFLRGGPSAAVEVAVLALMDMGLLRLEDDRITAVEAEAPSGVRRPLERAVLAGLRTVTTERDLLRDAGVRTALSEYEASLTSMGALPGAATMRARILLYAPALALLVGLAAAKILVALARGRHNVWFLVVLALVGVIAATRIAFPPRTGRGDALLADLRTLFTPLRNRIGLLKHGRDLNEFVFLAAAFGYPLLATGADAWALRVFRRGRSSGSFDGWDFWGGGSCGSSCGGGGSCGSGCGGGSCGGGCGGCGSG